MRIVTWTIRLIVFVLLAAFAAKNIEPVTLRFYFDLALEAPLVLVVLAAFALGALFGIAALLGTVMRQRREIAALRRRPLPPEAQAAEALPPIP